MNGIDSNHIDLSDLKKLSFFSQLEESGELVQLSQLVREKRVPSGEMIIQQNTPGIEMAVLAEGEVDIHIDRIYVPSEKPKIGDLIGEFAFFTKATHAVTAIAAKDCRLFCIRYEDLRQFIQTNPQLGLKIYHEFTLGVIRKFKSISAQLLYLLLGSVSEQVAHDIRAPLSVLRVLAGALQEVSSEDKELLGLVVDRIETVTAPLLKPSNSTPFQEVALDHLSQLVSNIIREKKVQYHSISNLHFEWETPHFTGELRSVRTSASEFQRVVSNLVDNSVEAQGKVESPFISLDLKIEQDFLQFSISDHGIGIPADILARLGQEKISFKKINGNGLGLLQAIRQTKDWGGQFLIESKEARGTTITIQLPLISV